MKSKDIKRKHSNGASRATMLASKMDLSYDEKISERYYGACSRTPKEDELKMAVQYVNREIEDDKGVKKPVDKKQAFEDVVWALFNTKEFFIVLLYCMTLDMVH